METACASSNSSGKTVGTVMDANSAIDAAAIVMESGGTSALAERTFNAVFGALTKRAGLAAPPCSVWRTDFVAVTLAAEGISTTILRRIPAIGLSLTRAAEAAGLGQRVAGGALNADTIGGEIDRIRKSAGASTDWHQR